MSARTELVALLDKALPADITVIPYARDIDAPLASTVMVQQDRVTPSESGMGLRVYEFTLTLIAKRTTAGPADDELDGLLEDVLFALEDNDTPAGVVFTEAIRDTYEDTNPAYLVTLLVTVAKGE